MSGEGVQQVRASPGYMQRQLAPEHEEKEMLMFQGTGAQGLSQDGLRDMQRGDRPFSTFPGQLHETQAVSVCLLLEPAAPPHLNTG